MTTACVEHYSIYVLELSQESGLTKKMKKQNTGENHRGYLYVGMTGLPVVERIANHVSGHKSCNLVRKYYSGGIFQDYNEYGKLFDYYTAVAKEKEVANVLRGRGFCVYQN